MKQLRWVMEGGFWDVDISTPITLNGVAQPVVEAGAAVPLGLSRGTRLSRPKQIDFMQRFMAAPFVPSYSGTGHGLSLQHVLTLPMGNDWFTTLLGQFNAQKLVSAVRKDKSSQASKSSWLEIIGRHIRDKSFYAFGFCSEFLLTPEDTILVAYEAHGDSETSRKKAVFHHKFPHHNLTMEAVWPGLYVAKQGNYWDVPHSVTVDLASVASDSGASYHLCLHHTSGPAIQSASLIPGLCIKGAISFKKNIDFWRSQAKKLRLVQPFDIFLSNPHVSASGIIGAVATAFVGESSLPSLVEDEPKGYTNFSLRASGMRSTAMVDLFSSLSFTAQHGNFQRLFFDLTRFHVRLDFPSGSKFISAAARLAQDLYYSQEPSFEAIQAICPSATLSLQQQIAGPFSLRVDSGVGLNLNEREWQIRWWDNPVIAVEYALQVLGSAKAVAWYAPKHKEFMVELRFFER